MLIRTLAGGVLTLCQGGLIYILHCKFCIFFIFLGVLLDEVGKWCIMVLRKTKTSP